MAKPTKTMTSVAPAPVEDAPEPSALACRTVVKLLNALDDYADHAIEELKEMNNPDKADALALLGVKLSQMQDQQRKLESDRRKASSKLTPGAVRAYLQALTKEEWSALARDVSAHFSGGSVLG